MASPVNVVNDQVVPEVADQDVLVDYVSPNLLPQTPDSEVVSDFNIIYFKYILILVFLFFSISL